jgi:TPR repeat protein
MALARGAKPAGFHFAFPFRLICGRVTAMKITNPLGWFCGALAAIVIHAAHAQQEKFDPDALRQLAERGEAKAQFELGLRLLGGEGLPKDEQQAAEWLQKAAAQHLPGAMNALGTLHEEGVGVPKDQKKALEWFTKGANAGDPMAQLNLAESYDKGNGVEKSPAEALKWLKKAANQNLPQAQMAYAWRLEHGQGSEKNTREAAEWYLKAAEQGLVPAQTHLAYLYYTGTGVPLDYRRAEGWYRLAAQSEDPWAHNDLAWFLATCPDESFHDGDTAVEFARSAVAKVKDKRYEVIDTLAAALARSGKFGEAVQTQMKAIVMLGDDKTREVTPEDRTKLEKELSQRLGRYQKHEPFADDDAKPEANTKPLVEDRILQLQDIPRRKKQPPGTPRSKRGGVIS